MHQVYFYEMTDQGGYADSIHSATLEARPMIGDIYLLSFFGKTHGLKVERVLLAGPATWHAYGRRIEADWSHPPYYGMAGDDATLVAHTLDQMEDFSHRYDEE